MCTLGNDKDVMGGGKDGKVGSMTYQLGGGKKKVVTTRKDGTVITNIYGKDGVLISGTGKGPGWKDENGDGINDLGKGGGNKDLTVITNPTPPDSSPADLLPTGTSINKTARRRVDDMRVGRQSTILTSSQGVKVGTALDKKTLLGG